MNNSGQDDGSRFQSSGNVSHAENLREVARSHKSQMHGGWDVALDQLLCNFPPPDEHFVGRQAQLAEMIEQMQPGKTVAICGPAGIGKSALAVQVARQIRQIDPERFPDGMLFYSFYAQPDYSLACEYIAAAFGVVATPVPELAVQTVLSGKRALIILDAAELADDYGPILDAQGDCAVLITSRSKEPAARSAWCLDLPPLNGNAAAALLCAWSDRNNCDKHIMQRICDRLGRSPFAIQLAGRYLKNTGERASKYAVWLETAHFNALGCHDGENITRLLERSMAQLSAETQRVLTAAGQFAWTPFSVAALAAALDCDPLIFRSAADELVNYGFLQRRGDHFIMHHALIVDFLRKYCEPEAEIFTRLADYYSDRHSAQNGQWDVVLHEERSQIIAVARACSERRHWQAVLSIYNVVKRYLRNHGFWTDLREILEYARTAAQQIEDDVQEVHCAKALGDMCFSVADYEAARRSYEEARPIYARIGDHLGEAHCTKALGDVYFNLGDYDAASCYYEEARAVYALSGARLGEAHCFKAQGEIALQEERWREAEKLFSAGLQLYRAIHSQYDIAWSHYFLGQVLAAQGQEDEAAESYHAALRLFTAIRQDVQVAMVQEALDSMAPKTD